MPLGLLPPQGSGTPGRPRRPAGKEIAACLSGSDWCRSRFGPGPGTGQPWRLPRLLDRRPHLSAVAVHRGRGAGAGDGRAVLYPPVHLRRGSGGGALWAQVGRRALCHLRLKRKRQPEHTAPLWGRAPSWLRAVAVLRADHLQTPLRPPFLR